MKAFCRNMTFLQNSGITLMVPFQITSLPAGLPWSSLTNTVSYVSKFRQVRFFCSHFSCLSLSQLSDNESCRKKHAYPKAYESLPTSGSDLYSTKTSQNSSLVPKVEKFGISRIKFHRFLLGWKASTSFFGSSATSMWGLPIQEHIHLVAGVSCYKQLSGKHKSRSGQKNSFPEFKMERNTGFIPITLLYLAVVLADFSYIHNEWLLWKIKRKSKDEGFNQALLLAVASWDFSNFAGCNQLGTIFRPIFAMRWWALPTHTALTNLQFCQEICMFKQQFYSFPLKPQPRKSSEDPMTNERCNREQKNQH